jgi:hypothetical protein
VGIQEKILQQFQKWDREKKIVTIVIKKSILAENEMGIVELSVGHDIRKFHRRLDYTCPSRCRGDESM